MSDFIQINVLQKDINKSNDMSINPDYALDPVTNALKRITGRMYDIDRIAKVAFCRDVDSYSKRFLFEKDVVEYMESWENDENVSPSKFVFLVENNQLLERRI